MKLMCAPESFAFPLGDDALHVVLYGHAGRTDRASAGASVRYDLLRAKLVASPRAWDLLSLALSVVTADLAGLRCQSSDGWTRDFDLQVAVIDPAFWTTQAQAIEAALAFLTTDRWRVRFVEGGMLPAAPREPIYPDEDCVLLLSGGLDSLIGMIDRLEDGKKPFVVSQIVRGDAEKQTEFAHKLGGGLRHLQLNHNAHAPGTEESSVRARSFIFIAYGVLAATTLECYHAGADVRLFLCENGFIALNPPLTGARVGSLSTRTAHPEFLGRMQEILSAANLRAQIYNPYKLKTKGEMLSECRDQSSLRAEAASSTSCGRFQRFNYRHCGRCVPCQVRRAAFIAWGQPDTTEYVYEEIGRGDPEHAAFDDVRSVAMAIAEVEAEGLDQWLGASLTGSRIGATAPLRSLIMRGLKELAALHKKYGVT